jgi:dipeptidyl aminopeptidase/acylaminoacyl peptidase
VRTFATTDAIQNCVPAAAELICTTENAIMPRRVVAFNPVTGSRRLIFDPNPEFRRIRLGSVRRLKWLNDRGLEAWGDLVLPPNLKRGEIAPIVVVQYNSRGFLRGGTGDEYPIYLLAARGFAVLSFERPLAVAESIPNLKSEVEANAANERGWAERRSVQSAILAGVDAAIATGHVDGRRIGITGLSDGATAVRFALINSDRFAAAAISSCCLEPKTVMTYGGIAWAEYNRAVGYPPATVDDPLFWRPMSLALNAGKIRTPLLMQLADEEYLLSLEAFEALREQSAPVELYVFPDEHHVKWQPVHRLAIYERNLDWFEFWLRCHEDPAPAKAGQYRRWEAMRTRAPTTSRLCPGPSMLSSSSAPMPRHRPAA